MNRFEIINRIGDRYHIGNTESGEFRACSHKNSVKNHGKHNHRKENGTALIITGKNFPETF